MMKLHDKGWIPVSGHWDDKKGATRMTKKEHWDPGILIVSNALGLVSMGFAL